MKPWNKFLPWVGLVALGLASATGLYAYSFYTNQNTKLPVKWPAGTIPLRIMLGASTNLSDGSSFNTSARTAAQTWNNFLGSTQFQTTFATGTAGDDNDVNELGFAANVFGKDFEGTTLAVTTGFSRGNERIEADIIFNTAYTWDSYRGNARFQGITLTPDIQRVALHELGHVLGLDHPDQAEPAQTVTAIMNSRIGNLDTLATDDTEGAQQLYGPPGAPANDNFANATVITLTQGNSTTLKGYNTNATRETGDPRQGDNPGGRSVWWRWTAPSSGSVTLDTKGSYYDTTLGVYTGSSLSGLTKVADNDDINPGIVQASDLTFNATAGTTYRFCVDGFNNSEQDPTDTVGADNGGLTLNLNFNSVGGTLPSITTQPASATVNTGATVSFSVVATGTAPLSYQWQLGGVAITGATSDTYSISSVTANQAGSYSVLVSNAAGSVTSNAATLTVNTPAPPVTPPSSGGGGGGGGGAPSLWFVGLLAALGAARLFRR
ncbi:matrixin family metalloprotease [Oleiharenicola lentus]|nr:matrixin family metalloprotease [Oleiharenicola lentus]